MKILGIDSSGMVASVAVMEDDILLGEYTTNYKKTHSQTLLPMLEELQKMIELDLTTIDAIAVAAGPGSFTGLRIGSATAKGLGLALDKPILSVSTIEAMAYNLWGSDYDICPLMDARRNQTYTGIYQFKEEKIRCVLEPCAVDVKEVLDQINENGRPVIFLGDGVPVFLEQIKEYLEVPYQLAPAHMNRQRAASLCVAAASYYKEGKMQTAAEHRPVYLRMSQAERERAQKEQAAQQKDE